MCCVPVREVYCHINDSDIPPSSGRVVDTHVSSRDMSDAMMNNTCFNTPDQRTLNIIDPDFHYLTVNCCPIDTPYFSEQLFRDKYGNNTNLSMLHLNIRSVPDHFLGLISFLDNLTIELKIIALSETWIKPYHIDYNMPHYSLEQDYRPKKRGGGVCLYIHKSLQYQLRKDLKIGNDSESVNSLFIEIDKLTIGTKYNVIIGCIYRPPWVKLADFNELLRSTLQTFHTNNKYVFLFGDFNVDLSLNIETSVTTEDFKNLFFIHHFIPLINKPTREVNNSKTIIDNIFCNVPLPFNMCDVGILCPYISDHHAILCILKTHKSPKESQSFTKRN